jgi:MFS transporter, PAT family, beta-lactamase induction signal transducer AmpG
MNRYFTVFTNKTMLRTLLLGFSSGIPLALVGSTLQAWLSDEKLDISTIGLFALVGLPYAMKFLWAPLMDLKPLPFLGLRRGWMTVTQIGLFAATIGLALTNPADNLSTFSMMALLVAFFSASQDIVVDAYRTEIVSDKDELGAAAGVYIAGYRIATVVSGGLALILADQISWTAVYSLMAAVNLVGLATILLSPEPKITRKVRTTSMRESVVQPFIEFFQRSGAMEILIFIMLYKLSTLMATALTTKFLMDIGYTKTLIGSVTKGVGLFATIAGTLVGGSLMIKFKLKKSLWIFGILQAMVGLTFFVLNHLVVSMPELKEAWLVIVICMDQFFMGLGTAALTGFMMNFASKQFTATQYALLTSVMAVSRVILIAHAGTIVEHVGYDAFFLGTVPLAIPGLLLLSRFDHWQTISTQPATARIPKFDLGMLTTFILALIFLSSDPIWKWMGQKEVGETFVKLGAYGVVIVVVVGLVRPYTSFRSKVTA